MGRILRNWRVIAASAFSVLLVSGAYALGSGSFATHQVQAATDTQLLKAIAAKDSDHDGLPDWEEALYGTDPHNPDTFHLGMTDGEAVAKGLIVPKAIANPTGAATSTSATATSSEATLTSMFTQNFLAAYLTAKQNNNGASLTKTQMTDIATQVLDSLASNIAPSPDFKSASDLKVSGSGPGAMRAYAESAEAVMRAYAPNLPKSELQYLDDAVQNNDPSALDNIATLAKAYREVAAGIAALPVPKELASEDLTIVNSMMRISEAANDFTRVNTDPLVTMLALKQYPQAVLNMGNAFEDIQSAYKAAGVTFTPGEPGANFVGISSAISSTSTPQSVTASTSVTTSAP